MIARSNAVVPMTPATDFTGNEGRFVKADATLAAANETPFGVITEIQPNGGDISVAVCAGGFAGTVKVKLGANGSMGDKVGSDAAGAGDSAATTVAAQLLEDGLADELVEAVIFLPV